MQSDKPPSSVRRIFEEAFNQGNLAAVDELLTPDHLAHNAYGGSPHGPQGLKWLVAMFRTAFPDLHCTVKNEIIDGEKSAAHWVMRGTQNGSFLGNQPTGRSVEIQGMIFAHTKNGRIAEHWILFDQLAILQQLGVIPPVIRH